MSLLLALPEWLTSEHYVTLATWGLVVATVLLCVATIILYVDARAKSKEQKDHWELEAAERTKEQRERWQREDQQRAEDARPKVVVELAKRNSSPEIVFSCFNLGNTIFFADQIIITVSMGSRHMRGLVGPPVLLPGTFVSIPLDGKELLRDGMKEANAVFELRGAQGTVRSEPVWFHFYPDEQVGFAWGVGPLSGRAPGTVVRAPREISELTVHAEIDGKIEEVYMVRSEAKNFDAILMVRATFVNHSAEVSPTIREFICEIDYGDSGPFRASTSDSGPIENLTSYSSRSGERRTAFTNLSGFNWTPFIKHNHRDGWLQFTVRGLLDDIANGSELRLFAVDGSEKQYLIDSVKYPWPNQEGVVFEPR